MPNPIDIVFSFDTTGSMYPCLSEVRKNIMGTITALFYDIPDLRISIVAHGDYCDRDHPYTIKFLDFSSDKSEIRDFIKNVERTGGGDVPECYELVLRTVREKLSWRDNSTSVLVMIGDATPHSPDYPDNNYHIDWKHEIEVYKNRNIQIYSIHAMASCRTFSKYFYETIANKTNGMYLTLEQFSDINDILIGVCYKQSSKDMLDKYVERIKPKANRNMGRVIATLTGKEYKENDEINKSYAFSIDSGLIPVPASRFQVFEIPDYGKVAIKSFVKEQGIEFQIGRGFYELTKTEEIQQYKEIILQDIITGDFFNGADVRKFLGLLPQIEGKKGSGITEKINLNKKKLSNYRVFVQSTSVNRALIPNTHFLYEVPDWDVVDDTVHSCLKVPDSEKKKGKTRKSPSLKIKEELPVVKSSTPLRMITITDIKPNEYRFNDIYVKKDSKNGKILESVINILSQLLD